VPEISKKIVYNLAEFGGTQNRKRIILFGINQNRVKNSEQLVQNFYNTLDKQITKTRNLSYAIKDLPKIIPLKNSLKRVSHFVQTEDPLHFPRFHNVRDISIFKELAIDSMLESPKFRTNKSKIELYNKLHNRNSNFQKYHVLEWNKPSNTICAHISKDGLRYIHPDPEQARSLTMREAARLQSFPDHFKFSGSQMFIYKMIGNSVAPLMAKKIALAIKETFK